VTIQTIIRAPGPHASTCRPISAETMKMPEPIMVPHDKRDCRERSDAFDELLRTALGGRFGGVGHGSRGLVGVGGRELGE
jgi:hypothetical protein